MSTIFYKLGQSEALQEMGLSEEETLQLIQMLQEAMEEEQAGQEQYAEISDTADAAGHPDVAAKADTLKNDEVRHEQMNNEMMQAVSQGPNSRQM